MTDLTFITIGWTLGFAAVATIATYLLSKRVFVTGVAGATSLVGGFFWFKLCLYLFTPAFVGTFWGQTGMMWAAAFLAVFVAGITWFATWIKGRGQREDRWHASALEEAGGRAAVGKLIGAGSLLVLMFVVWAFTCIWQGWGTDNIKRWAALANVRVESEEATLPPTNPDRIQMVTRGMAQFRGQQAITQGGAELSSFYMVREQDWVKVSVKEHTYWVAPLVYASDWMQFIGSVEDSPGFISVDAEDPNGEVKSHLHHTLKVVPNGYWMRSLERYVYYSGYTDGQLDDPTFEVDDEWQPYYTMTYTQPAFVIGGEVMKKMIVVNANTGEIKDYAPAQVPTWIERVMSDEIISDYTKWWGHYANDHVVWLNGLRNGGRYEQEAADMDFVFNEHDQSVWSIPMTSTKSSDASSTGVLYYDTRDNQGVFYPGLKGIGVGESVKQAFFNAPPNKAQQYEVKQIQLYAINGQPTYVAIYVQSQGAHGESFAGIGFLNARKINGANVIMSSNKRTALSRYINWLASGGANDADVSTTATAAAPIKGVVFRIGKESDDTYRFKLVGDAHTYTVTTQTYGDLALVQPGDSVDFSYVDIGQSVRPVSRFSDTTLEQQAQK
ncbi:MAG: hypothetical protein KC777_17345 [Cyanobacteria bacterium HKST-UBA02]|nr:hypothetical protein [Cyanobacteria bacterium HKST-UBA02]